MKALILLNDGGVAGGHVIQATRTAEALRRIGVDVELQSSGDDVDVGDYDVVHGFGLPRATLRNAREVGAAVVLSPIWWSADYTTGATRTLPAPERFTHALRLGGSLISRGLHDTARLLRKPLNDAALAFESADLLLPNSRLEARQIRADLGVTTPMHVVPNAVDPELFTPPQPDEKRAGVLYVGRVEPHKNQLGLINDLRGAGIPLTIAGPTHAHHEQYAALCRARADSSVTFEMGKSQEALVDVYRRAAVHVLPSWFETTGLSSLEAAATGCDVVTTSRGYAREYFRDLGLYCDPGSKGSIRRAVERALERTPPPSLRARVLENYTWADTARATVEGYALALTRMRRDP